MLFVEDRFQWHCFLAGYNEKNLAILEAISDLITKAGFPQLLLSPVNFEALYQQKAQQGTEETEETAKH